MFKAPNFDGSDINILRYFLRKTFKELNLFIFEICFNAGIYAEQINKTQQGKHSQLIY